MGPFSHQSGPLPLLCRNLHSQSQFFLLHLGRLHINQTEKIVYFDSNYIAIVLCVGEGAQYCSHV